MYIPRSSGGGGGGALRVTSEPFNATVTPNVDTTDLLLIGVLTGDLEIPLPVGEPTEGQKLEIQLLQDNIGDHTLTLGSDFIFPSSSSLSSPISVTDFTAANSLTTLLIEWSATRSKWKVISFVPGY